MSAERLRDGTRRVLAALRKSSPLSANLLREFSIPLIAGVVAAPIWANIDPSSYQAFAHAPLFGRLTLDFLVNEVFMAFFFGIAAVEITDSLLPGGSLNPPRKAVTPLLATAGGVIGPVGVYFLLNAWFGSPALMRGWGITTATDIALAWLVARSVFGKAHPAVSFLLLLAIADDAVGLVIIAVFYPDPAHSVSMPALLLVAVSMLIAFGLRRVGARSYWPYLVLGGAPSWLGLHWAHVHPALALVFIVPFMPHDVPAPEEAMFDVTEEEHSTLSTFEHEWKVVVDFGLLFFGLVNAGVQFTAVGPATWLVFLSLLIGKTGGIFCFGQAAKWGGFPLPAGMTGRDLLLVSTTAGIGLTVALFVAGAAFADPQMQGAAKMGALGSALIAPLVLLLARLSRPRRRA
jgi:NhaA family Na+:H+ antiporter